MRFIDFFAGVGGFRRGLELAGHECIGFCENDRFAVASYTSMHLITEEQRAYLTTLSLDKRRKEILKEEYRHGEWYADDVSRLCAGDIPKADCWTFGAPCQDFSIAGRRAGLEGERSSLVREIFRLVEGRKEEDRPEWLIYENVKGMFSSNRGLDYLSILSEMDRLGYDMQWQLINSALFVPQNRERVYTIGHLRSCPPREILPITGAGGENSFHKGEKAAAEPIFCDMTNGAGLKATDTARCLQARYSKGIANRSGEVSGVIMPVLTPDRIKKRQNGRRIKENGEPMFTLTAQDRHGVAIEIKEATKKGYAEAELGDSINLTMPESKTRRGRVGKGIAQTLDTSCNQGVVVALPEGFSVYAVWYERYQCYVAIRKLTPKECFRLQGWTDDYFEKAAFVNSDNQLYKQAGNGVTVDVVKAIGEKMKDEGD